MVHIAMHDAVQAIQRRFDTYSTGISPASGSVIAAAARRLVMSWPIAFPRRLHHSMRPTPCISKPISSNTDPGVAAGAQAAAAIIQMRVGDGAYPMPAPTFFGNTAVGQWRPTAFTATGDPVPMAASWLATTRPFAVMHASQMFSGTPPRVTSRQYTREYNEVKAG
jgi:hypothetical protein